MRIEAHCDGIDVYVTTTKYSEGMFTKAPDIVDEKLITTVETWESLKAIHDEIESRPY